MSRSNVVGAPDQAIVPVKFVPAALVAGTAPYAGTVTPVIAGEVIALAVTVKTVVVELWA